jgi:hypothetical protein
MTMWEHSIDVANDFNDSLEADQNTQNVDENPWSAARDDDQEHH